jgi:integrase
MAEPREHKIPPIGVRLSHDVERRTYGFRARVRWTDPITKERQSRTSVVKTKEEVEDFFARMSRASEHGTDPTITLSDYVAAINGRWMRGLDLTSTGEGYEAGLRLRVLPALGHIQVAKITPGMIDRTIDEWETKYSPSLIKNSISPLVRVLDEALRDDVISANPARNRARRSLNKNAQQKAGALRAHAIPDLETLNELADACGLIDQSYHDHVMISALLAARGSEVSGLRVGDVDWKDRLVKIERQLFPGKGGLVTKPTKGRKTRRVPILQALEPVLERLTNGRDADGPLLRGPRDGVLTTASVRRATKWDTLVSNLGLPNLTRHGLRHTGATWLADSGIPLHVLQQILGHESIETTKLYLHPDTRHLADAARQANAFLAGPSKGRSSRPSAPGL